MAKLKTECARYRAFISYSHSRDRRLATALQRELERFNKPFFQARALRIFRDETNLALCESLWPVIQEAIDQSAFFVYLASPEAADSRWVRRELDHWCATKSRSRLLIVLTGGDVVWGEADFDWQRTTAVPKTLKGVFSEEPLHLDMRSIGAGPRIARDRMFVGHVATIAAALHGRPKDEIAGEHIRRHRRVVRVTAAGSTLLVLALGASVLQSWRVDLQEAIAEGHRLSADEQRDLALQSGALARKYEKEAKSGHFHTAFYEARFLAAEANRQTSEGNTELAMILSLAAVEGSESLLGFAPHEAHVALQRAFYAHPQELILPLGDGELDQPAFSYARASAGSSRVLGHWAESAALWDSQNGAEVARWSGTGRTFFGAGDKYVVRLEDDIGARQSTTIWEAQSGRQVGVLEGSPRAASAIGTEDGLITGQQDEIRSIGLPGGEITWRKRVPGTVHLLELSPASMLLAAYTHRCGTLSDDERDGVVILDSRSGEHKGSLEGFEDILWRAEFAPDGTRVATVSLHSPCESADGFAGPPSDNMPRIWSIKTGRLLRTFSGHQDDINALAFSPDGTTLATASSDQTVRLWSVEAGALISALRHPAPVSSVVFSSDGRTLATGSRDGVVRLWDAPRGVLLRAFRPRSASVSVLEFLDADKSLVTTSDDGTVRITALEGRAEADRLCCTEAEAKTSALRWSRDGARLSVVVEDRVVDQWWVHSLERVEPPRSDDIVLASNQEAARLAQEDSARAGDPSGWSVSASVFEMDRGRSILFTDGGDDVGRDVGRVWDIATRSLLVSMRGHGGPITSAAFGPQSDRLATTSMDGTARLWDVETGTEIARFEGHGGAALASAFSPDGRLLATRGIDGSLHLWRLVRNEDLVAEAKRRVTREVTDEECAALDTLPGFDGSAPGCLPAWIRESSSTTTDPDVGGHWTPD